MKIDEESRDLVFDSEGILETIQGDDTTVQAVRLTLEVYKEEFPLDVTHGTDYDRIMGQPISRLPKDEVQEVLREAVFQEPQVSQIDQLELSETERTLKVAFVGMLQSGKVIKTEAEVR